MKNWMKKLPDGKKINHINMPGTHDSTACFVDFSYFSKTQSLTVAEQLEIGVRYFDFRFKHVNDKFIANHSIALCRTKKGFFAPVMTADDVVRACLDFIKSNPTETILFQLKEAESSTGESFYSDFYNRYIKEQNNFWYVKNEVPSLGEVRGKIVLLRVVSVDESFDDDTCGINFSSYPYVPTTFVNDWRESSITKIDGTEYMKLLVQDSYKVEGAKKVKTVIEFIDGDRNGNTFYINYASCTRFFNPKHNAKIINKELMNFDFAEETLYGILAIDYAERELCEKIVNSNF